ncbi:MAG: hypothetical protein LC126_04615 [Bryobacterales bacterium]|nr:hypothetical protein [Bryobacterales bacterium]
MTAQQYVERYKNLSVDLGAGGMVTACVEDYQNPGPNWHVKYDQADPPYDPKDPGKLKLALQAPGASKTFAHYLHWSKMQGLAADTQTKREIAAVHRGAGSPEQIAAVLKLAWLNPKTSGLSGTGSPRDQIMEYVRKWIGLYCTGFVGNFTQRVLLKTLGPENAIELYQRQLKGRTSQQSVQANDILVWTNFGHIAIIDSVIKIPNAGADEPSVVYDVAESSLDRPQYNGLTGTPNFYRIQSVEQDSKGHVFTVLRGKSDVKTKVYIVAP